MLVLKDMKYKIRRPQIFILIVYKISFFGGSSWKENPWEKPGTDRKISKYWIKKDKFV